MINLIKVDPTPAASVNCSCVWEKKMVNFMDYKVEI